MAYTHYFRGWATINDDLIEDVRRIIGNNEVSLLTRGRVSLRKLSWLKLVCLT